MKKALALTWPEKELLAAEDGVDAPSEPKEKKDKEMVRCLAVGQMVAKEALISTLGVFRQATEVKRAKVLHSRSHFQRFNE